MIFSRLLPVAAVTPLLLLGACSDSDDIGALNVPAQYQYSSQFLAGVDSVDYQGQTCRHTLITALKNAIQDPAEIARADYRGAAVPYFDDTISGALAGQGTQQTLGTELPVPEAVDTLGKLCGSKHLREKFAGNDTVTDHRDWNTEFAGVAGQSSAEDYLRQLLAEVSTQTAAGTNAPGAPHYVSVDGIDYAELIQKFLLMAVPFAQGTDDYLDDDSNTAGKGLLASAAQSGDKPYSSLEHAFDEGFGYFGAARDYAARTDEVNRSGVVDDNGDNLLDPLREHNFGAATNAAKRDLGSAAEAPTDFSGAAFNAFLRGRAIITAAGVDFSSMSATQQADLRAARDTAVGAWEGAIAATVVHYINDVLGDMDKIGTAEYSLASHAKHWAELKGFALGLQFNPRSPLLAAGTGGASLFEEFHALVGDRPALTDDAAYRTALTEARALLGQAYGFATVNLENW